MKQTSAELKRMARERMQGHWGLMIGASVLNMLILYAAILPCYVLFIMIIFMSRTATLSLFLLPILLIIILLVILLVQTVLTAGIMGMHMKAARGQEIRLSEMFSQFVNRPWRYIISGILLGLIAVACILPGGICMGLAVSMRNYFMAVMGILFYIGGFVLWVWILLRYTLVTYIFLDSTKTGIITAFKESSRMMQGNKGRMIYISLSFIGWLILGMLSCGIGMLWIMPYMAQTSVQFYLNVKESSRQEEEQE